MYLVACSGEYGPQISTTFSPYHFIFLLSSHYWQKRLSTFSLFRMDQILPKLLCMTIFCNSSFFFKNQTKSNPHWPEPLQVRSEVAAVRWGRSGRVHGLEFTKKQMMRVERFKAQRNDGVRRTLTLHLLLFLCKQQQHSGQTWTGFCIWVIVFCDLPAVWFRCSRQIAAGICCVSPRLDASVALGGRALSFALGCQ